MIKQVSIYTANTKGAMKKITGILKDNDINLIALVTNDSAEYGIVRLLASDSEKTLEALTNAGYMARITKVIGVRIDDHCGSLDRLLGSLLDSNIDVDYVYISYDRSAKSVIAVFDCDGKFEVEESLKNKGYEVMKDKDMVLNI